MQQKKEADNQKYFKAVCFFKAGSFSGCLRLWQQRVSFAFFSSPRQVVQEAI